MDQEVKRQWVAALRSGDYTQGNGALRWKGVDGSPDKFCCLGVLCDLAQRAGITGDPTESASRFFYGADRLHDDFPPEEVVEWAGLPAEDPDIDPDYSDPEETEYYTLSEANDNGLSFAGIADLIEEQL